VAFDTVMAFLDAGYYFSFAICLVSSALGALVLYKISSYKYEIYKYIGLALLSGFITFLIVIFLNIIGIDWFYADEFIVGMIYPFILGSKKFFERR